MISPFPTRRASAVLVLLGALYVLGAAGPQPAPSILAAHIPTPAPDT